MNLETRQARDAFVKKRLAQTEVWTAESIMALILELRTRFYSKKMPLNQIWITLWHNGFRDNPSLSNDVHPLLRAAQKKLNLAERKARTYFAYLTPKGKLIPSTIRVKSGDAFAALQASDAKYRHANYYACPQVKVTVKVLETIMPTQLRRINVKET